MPEQNSHIYNRIAGLARTLGFGDFGCTEAVQLDREQIFYHHALEAGHFADMTYLKRNIDKRLDPRLLIEGAKSVLCFLVPYGKNALSVPAAGPFIATETVPALHRAGSPRQASPLSGSRPISSVCHTGYIEPAKLPSSSFCMETSSPLAGRDTDPARDRTPRTGENYSGRSGSVKIASYAFGEDYHKVIKNKLHILLREIREMAPGTKGRVFVDSAPVLERAWAARAGLGFIGKNNFLISRRCGIRHFIGIIITDLELPGTRTEGKNHCGNCTRCLDNCPSGALCAPYTLDARKCISYQTIESKLSAQQEPERIFRDGWVFGCDACLNACPWNRKNLPGWEEFSTREKELSAAGPFEWMQMTPGFFAARFQDSPLSRAGLAKIKDSVQTCLYQEDYFRTTDLPEEAAEAVREKTRPT